MDAGSSTRATGPVLCSEIVGRDAEQAVIAGALERARAGAGGILVLVGEPGIGKSRLARDAEERASAMGMRALRGRGAPGAGPIPFRPLAEAISAAFRDSEPPDGAELEPYRAALGALVPEWSAQRAAEPTPLLLFEGLVRLLRALAGSGGLALVIEDLQWADADSLAALDYLADNLAGERVLCVVTMRDDAGPAMDVVEAIAARRAATRLPIRRLSFDETADVARSALGATVLPRALMEMLAERSEGVPFVIEEMLTAYVTSGRLETLPHHYRELMRGRVASLDESARRTLYAAATIGRRFEWPLLTAVTGFDHEQLLRDLRAAVDAKLIVAGADVRSDIPFGFRHALVREALIADLLPPELAELSARVAAAIEDAHPGLPGEWCERAAELREAAGDSAAAARHLQDAARRALSRGALASAESMLERARALVAADRWHVIGIDRLLVEVLSLAGKVVRLQQIGESALRFVQEKRAHMPFITLSLGDLHLRLARGMAAAGEDVAAEEHLQRAREHALRAMDASLSARLEAFEADRALVRGDLDRASAAAAKAAAIAHSAGLPDVVSEALSVEGRAAFATGDVERALATLERARDAAADPSVARIEAMIEIGVIEASSGGTLDTLAGARSLAERSGAVSSEARADLVAGRALLEGFDLEGAGVSLGACIDTCRRYRLALLSEALSVEAQRLALAGRMDEAEATIVGDAGATPLAGAVVALLREDHEAAARAPIDGDAVAHALASLLSAVRGEPVSHISTGHALAGGLFAFAELATHPPDARARFPEADLRLVPFPWWRHVARRLIADVAIADGWIDPSWLRECLVFFDAAGHDRIASACRALLRRAGAPVPRKGRGEANVPGPLSARGVTSREMDVLRLVGEGLGNKEIGARLFLSPRTIETHVASLQRKLHAGSRADLRRMGKDGEAGA